MNKNIFHMGIFRLCLTLVCLFWLVGISGRAGEHYVTPAGGYGTNNPPYTNWADAATNIQWAMDVATNGDMVWVTNGTYYLTNQITITNRVTVRSMNGYSNTVIFGNGANRCFFMTNGLSSLNGLTITNGYAGSNDYFGRGGGVLAYGPRCGIYNCLITGNRSDTTNRGEGGGGLYLYNSCTVAVCIIRGNSSRREAGGIDAQSSCIISNCIIDSNIASNRGGGMWSQQSVTCLDSQFISNKAYASVDTTYGGGGAYHAAAFAMFSNCLFNGNWSAYLGGGIFFPQSAGMVVDCIFTNNSALNLAGSDGYGGAFALLAFSGGNIVTALNCQIVNNSSFAGGGVNINSGGYILNCLLKNNSASDGGAMKITGMNDYGGYVSACTIVSNTAGRAAAISFLYGPTASSNSVYDCVIWGNNSTNNDWPVIWAGTNAFWYTCMNSTNFLANRGNITNDPLFIDFAGGNYRLNANSPCVNTGTNQSWMTNALDLDGRPRIRYGTVDMGAYEVLYRGTFYTVP